MPDTLNKQALVNLLIDSPLREPIKINLIDIVNNTSDADLPKVYSTITKELEIFQKATERRMKLAEETIAKLGGATTQSQAPIPPLDLPPLPPAPSVAPDGAGPAQSEPGLSVPPLDLPPLPTSPTTSEPTESLSPAPAPTTPIPPLEPLGSPTPSTTSDEDALGEIQKELDSLKTAAAADLSTDKAGITTATPTPAPATQA